MLGFDKKENCDIEKLLRIWPSSSTSTIAWNGLRQWEHQEKQKDQNIFSKKTLKS